jgi:hypothetical protein
VVRPAPLAALLIALASLPAAADMMPAPPPRAPEPADFWAKVLHPHAREVGETLQQLEIALRQLDDPYGATDRSRVELVRNGVRMARYARTLDPGDPDVVYFGGAFADAAGRALEAERLLSLYLRTAPAGARRADALVRIGRIALRQGRAAAAVDLLRQAAAQLSDRFTMVRARVALAAWLDPAYPVLE